jgi:ribosomal protein L20A (L18A)
MIVAAENKKQAVDFAFELFQPEYKMSRQKVKITAERF